jgi:hypothetical protein
MFTHGQVPSVLRITHQLLFYKVDSAMQLLYFMRGSLIQIMHAWKDGTLKIAYKDIDTVCIAHNRTFTLTLTVPYERLHNFASC